MVNSKQKGGQFERDVCKALSLWVSGGSKKDVFWRSAMSGGRSTIGKNKGEVLSAQAGDISTISPIGYSLTNRFILEAKFYKSLEVSGLVTGTGNLLSFWKVLKKDALFHKRVPLLIAKQNRIPTVLCTDQLGVHLLNAQEFILLEAPKDEILILDMNSLLERGYEETRLLHYNYRGALNAFRAHKCGATTRGIEFEFSFDEWVSWWEGALGPQWQKKRGCKRDQFCMARAEDKGPYAPWNVKCILHEDNVSEKAINNTAAYGTRVNTNKLTEAQVISIFYDQRRNRDIATEYGVDYTLVWLIKKKKKCWKRLLVGHRIRLKLDNNP